MTRWPAMVSPGLAPDALRIGVNALYLIPGGVGGTEIYLRNLLAAMARVDQTNEYLIFTNRETGLDLVPHQANFHGAPQGVRATFRPARIWWEQFVLPLAVGRHRCDVLFNPGFTCPALAACPNVTVFHDLQHKRHPEFFRWFDLPFWNLLLWTAVQRSRGLIAVSEATRDDLYRYYGKHATVIHHGVEPEFARIAEGRAPEEFLLCVSTLHPHKNLERLANVCAQLDPPRELVIAGLRGFAAQRLEESAGKHVRFTGWIPREQVYDLFRRARAFVYPSRFEGFGMPVLEAMAAGIPLACSGIAPLREIADGCAFFFDPDDEASMRQAIDHALGDSSLVEKGRQRAAQFTWERAARETIAYLSKSSS